jgi:WD40 repeat protein
MKTPKTIADDFIPPLPWDNKAQSGDQFASYVLGDKLGQGNFGSVFKVQPDPNTPWYEAIKILHRSSQYDKANFLTEIERLKKIRLSGMANIHSAGEAHGQLYYSMDYINGLSIDDYLKSAKARDLNELFLELCGIVQKLHEQNFIHRDLKPQNIMISEFGEVRLLDFGISRQILNTPSLEPVSATYEFASPSQIRGDSPCPQMDIYALATLFYYLSSGVHPKTQFGQDPESTKNACAKDLFAPLTQNMSSQSQAICQVINKALKSEFLTITEFIEELSTQGISLPQFIIQNQMDLPSLGKSLHTLELEFKDQLQILLVQNSKHKIDFVYNKKQDINTLRQAIHNRLSTQSADAWDHSPFLALRSFNERDCDLFFGRETEVNALLKQLSQHNEIAILAPSGAGKSSFIHAGIVPLLRENQSQIISCTPAQNSINILKQEISSLKPSINSLLIIDQFEEALRNPPLLKQFKEILIPLQKSSLCKIIFALRNDSYKELISYNSKIKIYNLPPPKADQIKHMIRLPAIKAKLRFEWDTTRQESLDETLLQEAKKNPENLTALSFTLDAIFNKSPKGIMSSSAYTALGGIGGAMARRAEEVFKQLKLQKPEACFHSIFHQLVRLSNNQQQTYRRYASYHALCTDSDSQLLCDTFIKEKLFQLTQDVDNNESIVSVSHEALIQSDQKESWPRFNDWITHERKNLLIAKRLQSISRSWNLDKTQAHLLFSNLTELNEIRQLIKTQWVFSNHELGFIRASKRRFKRALSLISTILLALIIISFYSWRQNDSLDTLRHERAVIQKQVNMLNQSATDQQERLSSLRQQEEVARHKISNMNHHSRLSLIASLQQSKSLPPGTALSLLSEVPEPGRNWLWGRLLQKSLPQHKMLFGHQEEILSCDFSPDNKYLVTASWDDKAILWNAQNGEKIAELFSTSENLRSDLEHAKFTYDGHIVVASNDGNLYTWRLENILNGNLISRAIPMPHDKIRKLFFSADNHYLICADSKGTFSIWDWKNKNFSQPLALQKHSTENNKRLYSVSLSPDQKFILSSGWDGQIKMWPWDGKRIGQAILAGEHESEIWWSEWSPSGKFYLSAGKDRLIKVWETASRKLKMTLKDSDSLLLNDIRCARFSPDEQFIVSGSRDKHIRIFDLKNGMLIRKYKSHDNLIYMLAFSSDGAKLASSSADQLVNLYDFKTLIQPSANKATSSLKLDSDIAYFDLSLHNLLSTHSNGLIIRLVLENLREDLRLRVPLSPNNTLKKAFQITQNQFLAIDDKANLFIGDSLNKWQTFRSLGPSSILNSIDLSPNKKTLALAFQSGFILIIDLASPQKIAQKIQLQNSSYPVIKFLENNNEILIGDQESQVQILNRSTQKLTPITESHSRKIFSVNSRKINDVESLISCSRDGTTQVLNRKTNQVQVISHGLRGDATQASLSPNGQFLISSSSRNTNIFIWDLKNKLELLPLSGHQEAPNQLLFANDQLIISSSPDKQLRLWRSLPWLSLKKKLNAHELQLSPLQQLQLTILR